MFSKLKALLGSHSQYLIYMILASVAGISKAAVFAKILAVNEFAIFSSISLINIYLMYIFGLGIEPGYLRNGSVLIGQKNKLEFHKTTGALFSFLTLFLSAVSILSLFIFLLDKETTLFLIPRNYLAFIGLFTSSALLYNLSSTLLRVRGDNNRFAFFLLLKNSFSLVIGLIFAKEYGLSVILLSEIFIQILLVFFTLFKAKTNIRFIDFSSLKSTIKTGLPISINNFIKHLSLNIDRWVIMSTMSATLFAGYSFSLIVLSAGLGLLGIVTNAYLPYLFSEYGKDKDLSKLMAKVNQTIKLILLIAIPTVITSFIFGKNILELIYPKYSSFTISLNIVLVGTFLHIMNFYEAVLIAKEKGFLLVRISMITLIALCFMLTITHFQRATLEWYALVFTLGRGLTLFLTFREAQKLKKEFLLGTVD